SPFGESVAGVRVVAAFGGVASSWTIHSWLALLPAASPASSRSRYGPSGSVAWLSARPSQVAEIASPAPAIVRTGTPAGSVAELIKSAHVAAPSAVPLTWTVSSTPSPFGEMKRGWLIWAVRVGGVVSGPVALTRVELGERTVDRYDAVPEPAATQTPTRTG